MTQYPGYEIERFEYEGGSCYFPKKNKDLKPIDREMEEIPVIDLLGDDNDAWKQNEKHQES